MSLIKKWLYSILLISSLATIGSLYIQYFGDPITSIRTGDLFNPENGLPSCDLCRYIRICTYPLVIISLVGLRKIKQQKIDSFLYTLPFVLIGIALCVYKYYLQKFSSTGDSVFCTSKTSCGDIAVEYFGFMTLPFLWAIALLLIGGISLYVLHHTDDA